jgi:hypothetical protein
MGPEYLSLLLFSPLFKKEYGQSGTPGGMEKRILRKKPEEP